MLVKDFITKEIPVLKNFDTAEYALALMDDFRLRHLPLADDGIYVGLVSEKDLLALPDPRKPIGDLRVPALSVPVGGDLHEALGLMTRYGLSLLPVVDERNGYVGALTRDKLVDVLAELCGAEAEGSVIALELLPRDYSLTDVARIVESNQAHVISLLSMQDKDTGRLVVVLKIDLEDASPVIRSFERFNYTVLYHCMERGVVDEELQRRVGELVRYMNI